MNSSLFDSYPSQYSRLVTTLGCAVAILALASFSNTQLDTDHNWIVAEVRAQESETASSAELSEMESLSETSSQYREPDPGQASRAWNYFLKFTSTGAREIVEGYEALRRTFGKELSEIQGENFREQLDWIQDRVRTDPVGRTLWYLIFAFTAVGAVFVLIAIFAVVQRIFCATKRRSRVIEDVDKALEGKIRSALDSTVTQTAKSVKTSKRKVSDTKKPATRFLLAGDLDGTEKVLHDAVKKDSNDVTSMLYLLCVRVLRNDVDAYQVLFEKLNKSDRLRKSAVFRHAGEIGRMLSPDQYNIAEYPPPTKPYHENSNFFDDGTEQVAEFGDISTLLDLALVYLEMKESGKAAQAIVELLARGDEFQRRQAVKLSQRLDFSSTN